MRSKKYPQLCRPTGHTFCGQTGRGSKNIKKFVNVINGDAYGKPLENVYVFTFLALLKELASSSPSHSATDCARKGNVMPRFRRTKSSKERGITIKWCSFVSLSLASCILVASIYPGKNIWGGI